MIKLLEGIFNGIKGIISLFGYMINGIKSILTSIPAFVAYIQATIGVLPSIVVGLFGVGVSFLILKAIYKYTM